MLAATSYYNCVYDENCFYFASEGGLFNDYGGIFLAIKKTNQNGGYIFTADVYFNDQSFVFVNIFYFVKEAIIAGTRCYIFYHPMYQLKLKTLYKVVLRYGDRPTFEYVVSSDGFRGSSIDKPSFESGLIKKDDILIKYQGIRTIRAPYDWDMTKIYSNDYSIEVKGISSDNWEGNVEFNQALIIVVGGEQREYRLRFYKAKKNAIIAQLCGDTSSAQYLQYDIYRTRLNTLFARQLTERAVNGIDAILTYETQLINEPAPGQGRYVNIVLPKWEDTYASRSVVISIRNVGNAPDTTLKTMWRGMLLDTPQSVRFFVPCSGNNSTGIKFPADEKNIALDIILDQPKSRKAGEFHTTFSDTKEELTGFSYTPDDSFQPNISVTVLADKSEPMDFSGANAIYFWELFYYTPMMVMQRFLQEERHDLAEKWLKYIFSPSGYIVQGGRDKRMWNTRPLEEDTSWNSEPLKSYDPDAVAQNDPMHYKLNAFMRLLDITIGKGDVAYRKLERDTLSEAKVWYGRALSLLGDAPWIEQNQGWGDPVLSTAASAQALTDRIDALSQMAQNIRRHKDIPLTAVAGSTLFFPESNEVILGYWETLRIRLYNLRHNLTLDGKPLNLPLYATPADPKALLAAAVAAEGGSGSGLPTVDSIPALRFTPMLESARAMASQLIQFGSSMQQILLSQDAEALAELLSTQGAELAGSSLSLQKQTLNELAAERLTLEKSLESATTRRDHYRSLYQENINARENHAMNLLTSSQLLSAGIKPLYVAGAVAGVAPNIFGLANGGMKYEGPLNAAGIGMEIAASALNIAGQRITQEEQYRRRREEWDIQHRAAEKEMGVIQAQLDALTVRETSAQMQIAHMETQEAHAKAQLALFRSKFTGKAMYSWLRGRLATIFYQYYDLTASLCLMAQKSLQYETGDVTKSWLKTGTWNGAWAGLMAGEGLMLSLAQMELAWMKHQKRELEVTRTVSLAELFDAQGGDMTFVQAVKKALGSGAHADEGGIKVGLTNGELVVHFNLQELNVAPDYAGETLRVRSMAVTLPALLGPYQNVMGQMYISGGEVNLPVGCERCAISHALQDNGMFMQDGTGDPRWGARWLPFEGVNINQEGINMTLSFADALGDQKSLLESLNDVILHIQFTVR